MESDWKTLQGSHLKLFKGPNPKPASQKAIGKHVGALCREREQLPLTLVQIKDLNAAYDRG